MSGKSALLSSMSTHNQLVKDRSSNMDPEPFEALSPDRARQSTKRSQALENSYESTPFPIAGDLAPNLMKSTSQSRPTSQSRSTNSSSSRSSTVLDTTPTPEPTSMNKGRGIDTRQDDLNPQTEPPPILDGEAGGDRDGVDRPVAPTRMMTTMSNSTGRPYSAFSSGTKWLIVGLAGVAGVFSPIRLVSSCLLLDNHSSILPLKCGVLRYHRTRLR